MNECIGSNAGQWAFLLLSFHHLLPHHTPLHLFPRDAGLTHVRGTPVAQSKAIQQCDTHHKRGHSKKKDGQNAIQYKMCEPPFLANYPLTAKMHSIL